MIISGHVEMRRLRKPLVSQRVVQHAVPCRGALVAFLMALYSSNLDRKVKEWIDHSLPNSKYAVTNVETVSPRNEQKIGRTSPFDAP
jgi:hypothetical protein